MGKSLKSYVVLTLVLEEFQNTKVDFAPAFTQMTRLSHLRVLPRPLGRGSDNQ